MIEAAPSDDELQSEVAHQSELVQAVMPALGSIANTESARAVAQVQAAALLARTYKRDPEEAIDNILKACERYTLAQKAMYVYSRGGEEVSGPTIRLAEAVIQHWGNMRAGVDELSRDMEEGISVCRAYAHDLQTGLEDEKTFHVRHWRDVRNGRGYRVKTERDIGELVANFGARRKRACIQAVVPAYVFEEAIERCEQTLYDNVRTDGDAIESMLKSFADLGITQEHIEARIRRTLAEILPAQMIALHKIYNSLKGQESAASDWFDIVEVDPAPEAGTGTSVKDIVERGTRREQAKASQAARNAKPGPPDEIERLIVEAKTNDELNAATVKIGPLTDLARKERLYAVADERYQEFKKADPKA